MVKKSAYRCKNCGGNEFRQESRNSVDVELDKNGEPIDIGFAWSDEDLTDEIYCNNCGESVRNCGHDFKCRKCGQKYPEGFCATQDVSLCKWCSGEEVEDMMAIK